MLLPDLLVALLDRQGDGHALYAPEFAAQAQPTAAPAAGDEVSGPSDAGDVVRLVGVYMNPVGLALRELTPFEFVGSDLLERLRVQGTPDGLKACLQVVHGDQPLHRQLFAEQQADRHCVYEVDATKVPLPGGPAPWLLHVGFRDVSHELEGRRQLERTAADLERLARTDPLTSLPNRRAWQPGLTAAVQRAAQNQQRQAGHHGVQTSREAQSDPSELGHGVSPEGALCVAIADLDRFKDFNDRHGHLAGDELLRQLGITWAAELDGLGAGWMLARLGGEEFGLLLPTTPLEEARSVCERLKSSVPDDQTVSIGLTRWRPGELAEAMLGRADAALYAAKHAGRDRVVTLLAP